MKRKFQQRKRRYKEDGMQNLELKDNNHNKYLWMGMKEWMEQGKNRSVNLKIKHLKVREKINKKKQTIKDTWDYDKRSNGHVVGILEGDEKESWSDK